MRALYEAIGMSKQAFHQWKNRERQKREIVATVCYIIDQVRIDHPGMGVRAIWKMMSPPIGRDEFEYLAILHGYGIVRRRNFRRTTDSRGVVRFPNLLENIKPSTINEVWVSDITYYWMQERFYYLTFVLDLFCRKLIGYAVSKTLKTVDTTIPSLQYALSRRKGMPRKDNMILHSDRGGQYYSNEFLSITHKNKLLNSMGKTVYDNPVIERFHSTIKNQYIYLYGPTNFKELKQATARACMNYNRRPHETLGSKSPNDFERNHIVDLAGNSKVFNKSTY